MTTGLATAAIRTPLELDNSKFLKGLDRSLGGVRDFARRTAESMQRAGRAMSLGITAPLVGIGTTAVKTAADFESQMAILGIAAGQAGVSIEELQKVAIKTGADAKLLGISASESAEAITNFYKAGMTTNEVFGDMQGYLEGTADVTGAFRAAVDLAAASDLDLAQASDAVAVAMATFGMNAEEATGIADSFVQAADASVAEVGGLVQALTNVGPTAAQFGWSIGDVNTALAILSERGIQGSEAGTALKSMMTNIMRPTDDVTETLQKLGVALYDTEGAMFSLPDIIGQLTPALDGLSEEQKNLAIQTLAGTYGMKAMGVLVGEGTEGWYEMAEGMASAATAQEVAEARADTFAVSMEALQGTLETLMIQVGLPLINNFLRPLADKLSALVGRLTEVNPEFIDLAIKVAAVAAAIGPALIVGSKLLALFTTLLSPVGLVVVAVGALAAAFATNFMGIRDAVMGAWSVIQPIVGNIVKFVSGLVSAFQEGGLSEVLEYWESVWPQFSQYLQVALGDLLGKAKAKLSELAQAFVDWIGPKIPVVLAKLGELAQSILSWVGEQIPVITARVSEWAQAFIGWIGPKIPGILEGLGTLAQSVLIWIGEQIPIITETVAGWARAFIGWIGPKIPEIVAGLGELAAGVLTWISEQIPVITETVAGWAQAFVGWIGPKIPEIVAGLGELAQGILVWVGAQIPVITEKVGEWAAAFVGWIGPKIPEIVTGLGELVSGVLAWVGEQVPKIQARVSEWAQAFIGWIGPKIPEIVAGLQELVGSVLVWIGEQVPILVGKLAEWGQEFVAWVAPQILPLLAKLGELASGVLAWLGEQIPPIIAKLVEWGQEFVAWIGPQIPPLLAKLGELARDFFSWIGEQAAPLLAKLGEWAASFVAWIGPAAIKFLAEWPAVLWSFLEWIEEAAGPILERLGDWALSFIEWIVPTIPKVILALAGIAAGIGVFIIETASLIGIKLLTWATAFYEWITGEAIPKVKLELIKLGIAIGNWIINDAVPLLAEKAEALAQAIEDGVRTGVSKIWGAIVSIGSSIIDGIKAGISGKMDALRAEIENLLGKLPGWAKKILGIASPSKVFMEIGANIMAGMVQGIEDKTPEAVTAVAEAVSSIVDAFSAMMDIAPDIAEFPTLSGFKDGVDRLLADMEYILVAIRNGVHELWGWGGDVKDTVWGHLKCWAGSVGAVVELVGQAVEVFTKVNDYTGIMPGVAETLAADIKRVVEAVVGAIGEGGGLSEFQVQWAEFAASLISTVTDIISDLETLAAFEGGLAIAESNIRNLVNGLEEAVYAILVAFETGFTITLSEGFQDTVNFITAWTELAGGMVSALAGVISDLETLTAFEGGLAISEANIRNLVRSLEEAVYAILVVFATEYTVTLSEGFQDTVNFATEWTKLAGGMVSALAGVISDLETLTAFEGGLTVSAGNVTNLVETLGTATDTILAAIGTVASDFQAEGSVDQLKAAWLEFSAGLISTVGGVVGDLETLAAFEGGLVAVQGNVENLVDTLEDVAGWILGAVDPVSSDFNAAEGSVDQLKAAWLEFSAGLISTVAGVIEDMKALAAFEGGLAVESDNVINLVETIDQTATDILDAIGEVVSDFQAEEGSVDALKAAWLDFSAGLISTVTSAIDNLKALAAFEGDLDISTDSATDLVEQLDIVARQILAALGEAVPPDTAEDSLNELKARWLEFASSIVGTVTDAIGNLAILTELEADWTVPLDAVDNLVQQLDTVARQILTALGEAVPDVSGDSLNDLKAKWAEFASGLVGAIAGAIDSLAAIGDYVSVSNIVTAVKRLVADLQSAVDTITTELAGVSWTEANAVAATWAENAAALLGHIGGVVSSMESIGDYEAESLVDELRRLIGNLTEAVAYITENFPTITIPEGLLASATNASTILGHIQTIAEAIARIGELEIPSAAFRARLFNISSAMQKIADMDMEPFRLAVGNAGQLLIDVRGVIQSIEDIISTLASLGELSFESPNLQQVGAQLVGAFAGGFVQATSAVAEGMLSAVSALMQTVQGYARGFSEFFTGTGRSLGSSLIQGMIDGLLDNTSALYQVIAQIVANAIGAAQAAAGVASPSTETWRLGDSLVAGLVGSLSEGQAAVAQAMSDLMTLPAPGATMVPATAAVGGAGAGGDSASTTHNAEYHYHESEGIGADTRASLRQDFAYLQFEERLQRG